MCHNSLYQTGHNEVQLAKKSIDAATEAAGLTDNITAYYRATVTGFHRQPGLIVMPLNNATLKNITVFPDAANAEQIQSAIKKASY